MSRQSTTLYRPLPIKVYKMRHVVNCPWCGYENTMAAVEHHLNGGTKVKPFGEHGMEIPECRVLERNRRRGAGTCNERWDSIPETYERR